MTQPFLVFAAPDIQDEEIAEVNACLRSGWLGTGPRVARFEKDFAAYKRMEPTQAAAMNSCTAALHVSMISAGLSPGAEVITTPLTFCATVNAIIHAGLTPVLADIDPVTQNIDPAAIEAAISPRTEAILPVHFAGRPCDMDAIMAIAAKHKLRVIEDCAHAIESEYKGLKTGTIGDIGCFSFYVTKNIVTGEGGMLLARDPDIVSRARMLALHGMSQDAWHRFSDKGYRHYEVLESGFKYNMMDIQAALGIHQLRRVEQNWQKREVVWRRYLDGLRDLPVLLPPPHGADIKHAYHLFTIQIDEKGSGGTRDAFVGAMHKEGIGTGVHYRAIPEHSAYQRRFGWSPGQWPVAQRVGSQTVSLPLSPALTSEQVDRVIQGVGRALNHSNT